MFDVSAGTGEMDLLRTAADGMSAQRAMLDLAARNVAAAQASTPDHPYSRLVAQFAPVAGEPADADANSTGDDSESAPAAGSMLGPIHAEPGTGDALTEMIAVLDAQRAYEQNASIFDIGKRLAERTIDIGRG